MTRKEAIKNLKELLKWYLEEELLSETVYKREAVDLAISALSAEEDNTMEWIYEGDEISGVFRCSKCGMESEDMEFEHFRFCPNCGRKRVSK